MMTLSALPFLQAIGQGARLRGEPQTMLVLVLP